MVSSSFGGSFTRRSGNALSAGKTFDYAKPRLQAATTKVDSDLNVFKGLLHLRITRERKTSRLFYRS